MGVAAEEIDESVLWLELLGESGILPAQRLSSLSQEANELFAIFVSSQLTAKGLSRNSSIRKSVDS
jgi:hypothetical protein